MSLRYVPELSFKFIEELDFVGYDEEGIAEVQTVAVFEDYQGNAYKISLNELETAMRVINSRG